MNTSRRVLLKKLACGITLIPLLDLGIERVFADDLPLLKVDDPAAKALKYVEDASKSSAASPGNNCENCMLYQGAIGSTQGPCSVFPGKQVKAKGWCSSWAPQM